MPASPARLPSPTPARDAARHAARYAVSRTRSTAAENARCHDIPPHAMSDTRVDISMFISAAWRRRALRDKVLPPIPQCRRRRHHPPASRRPLPRCPFRTRQAAQLRPIVCPLQHHAHRLRAIIIPPPERPEPRFAASRHAADIARHAAAEALRAATLLIRCPRHPA